MGTLFQKRLLDKYVEENLRSYFKNPEHNEIILKWIDSIQGKSTLKESNLEQQFNEDFFLKILGYTGPPSPIFNFLPKKSALEGLDIPDFIIGNFALENGKIIKDDRRIVGELKGPNTDLDKIDVTRKKSPVEQAFEYGRNNGNSLDWIIVSNMKIIRLYKNTSMFDYIEFDVRKFIEEGNVTKEFLTFFFLLHREFLLDNAPKNKVYDLLLENLEERIKITEVFYNYYKEILNDVYNELCKLHLNISKTKDGQIRLAQSARKLLHRGLMVCFMSDHPHRILPKHVLGEILESAEKMPILSTNKIYPILTDFFKCIDNGSPGHYPYKIFGYDGGLFHYDELIDNIVLPDYLFYKKYNLNGKELKGIFGFKEIDFYYEMSPHILGKLFELSITEEEALFKSLFNDEVNNINTLNLRSDLGLVYTGEILSNFCAESVLSEVFNEIRNKILYELYGNKNINSINDEEEIIFWNKYMENLLKIRIADIAVGSGAFLVSCYNVLKREVSKSYEMQRGKFNGLNKYFNTWESSLLDDCFFGKDIMPGAIEIAKLSLWISSIKRESKLNEFNDNFIIGDSLDVPKNIKKISYKEGNYEQYDIIIGNPPWGAEIETSAKNYLKTIFEDIENIENFDSFELFLLVGLKYLKNEGRMCYLLPHTILHDEKERIRKLLIENYKIEKWYNLGAEWFGSSIRMNTNVLQIKKIKPDINDEFFSMILVGEDRKNAIKGIIDLAQLEKTYSNKNPIKRTIENQFHVELFRFTQDDSIIKKIESSSQQFGIIADKYRGIELGKEGELLQCPACGKWMAPPRPKKGISIDEIDKICIYCKYKFKPRDSLAKVKIVSEVINENEKLYVDGDGILGRYKIPQYRSIKSGYDGVDYKNLEIYNSPKLIIRETGVGLSVALDEKNALCPRTIFILKLKEKYKNLNYKFLLGVLQSRTLAYYIFKKYGQIDAAQAFGKFTQQNIYELPIPINEISEKIYIHNEIAELVDKMLTSELLGSNYDWNIERLVQQLYNINTKESAYIMSQLGLVAYHKAMQEMFPKGPPPKPKYIEDIILKRE